MVGRGSYPADIGTDHAYIPIYLVCSGICGRAVCTDIKDGPLRRAAKNIEMYGLQQRIALKKGSGLAPISGMGVGCAIMSGMGGFLICGMLEESKETARSIERFILQPMQEPDEVRKYLYRNDYSICDEKLVKDGNRIYQVMSVTHGRMDLDDEIYFEVGKKLIENRDPLLQEFIGRKIDEIRNVISILSEADSDNAKLKLARCAAKLKRYTEVMRCL